MSLIKAEINELKDIISKATQGKNLNHDEMRMATIAIMEGKLSDVQTASLLTGLRIKGETASEISGCVEGLMAVCLPLNHNLTYTLDTCGTGGDNLSTFNISTAVAFVAAAAGVKVAKHGNRAASGRVGSADVLEALGLRLDLSPFTSRQTLEEHNLCFLFAPTYHPAMAKVAGVRRKLGFKTIFNLVGPLANPSRANRQLIGVPDIATARIVAEALKTRTDYKAMIVAGHGGMDELSTTGMNILLTVDSGLVSESTLTPEEAGLKTASIDDLRGGDVAINAAIIENVISGIQGPAMDIVLFNAGAAIHLAGLSESLPKGVLLARSTIESGKALQLLNTLREVRSL